MQVNEYKRYFPTSLVMHVVILIVLFGGFALHARKDESAAPTMVNAVMLDSKAVDKAVKSLASAEDKQLVELKKAKRERLRIEKKAHQIRQEIKAQQAELAKVKKQVALQKKQADVKKKRELSKAKATAAKKAQEQAKAKKAADDKAKKLAADKAKALAAEKAAKFTSELGRYKGLIVQAIGKEWHVPTSATQDMSAKLLIDVDASGIVQNVQVIQSSHNMALDRSAVSAVYKASPLPVPADKDLLDEFRHFALTVTPKDILS